jgi:nicotinate (nicotinamide) nucleotide adenylyltransferase
MDKSNNTRSAEHTEISAIFGGTFDPPHYGHLKPLQETADITEFQNISLLPANVPVFKENITDAKHRIAMTKLLCKLDKRFSVDLTEFKRDSTSYTIDTVMHLKNEAPKRALVFIVGLDSLLSLHLWERWQQLFDYCHIMVMQRPAISNIESVSSFYSKDENMAPNMYNFYTSPKEFDAIVGPKMDETVRLYLNSKLARAENDTQCINHCTFKDIISNSAMGNLWFIKNQVLPLSSSFIRERMQAGKNIGNWVPESINDYIKEHQLYIK